MKSFHICILSVDNQPEYLGGVKRVTSILGAEWMKGGHQVYYLTSCSSSIRKTLVNNIPQFFLPNPENIDKEDNISWMIQFIKEQNIDILLNPHVEDQGITRLAQKVRQMIGVKTISALHFSPVSDYNIVKESFFITYALGHNLKNWVMNFILWIRFQLYKGRQIKQLEKKKIEKTIKESDAFVLLSNTFFKYFNNQDCIYAINNPIDNLQLLSKKNKEKNVIWCGRMDLTGAKRIDRMLKIWGKIQASHSDWKLQLLGSGDINRINTIIKKHHLNNIVVVGFCNPYDYYEKASIVCSTSTVEGWGMVLVEGQQYGCVPIAFDSYESVRDIIEDGKTGLLVKPFDLDQYAEELCRLMDDEELYSRMSAQARLSVKRFHSSLIAQQWLNLFQSLQSKS